MTEEDTFNRLKRTKTYDELDHDIGHDNFKWSSPYWPQPGDWEKHLNRHGWSLQEWEDIYRNQL